MSYTINRTDGSILAIVPDNQIDQSSTDLTLIGKNYDGFGDQLNENFVRLLENFANSQRPNRPVRGQLWFDTAESKLKVYTGTGFLPVSSATIATTRPLGLGVGDLWFNDTTKQLFFYDGTSNVLLAPQYSSMQGKSGLFVETINDRNNSSQVVNSMYISGILIGIFSRTEFTPAVAIDGYGSPNENKVIYPGFNAGNVSNFKFYITATNSERLGNYVASDFAIKTLSNTFDGSIRIANNDGLVIGESSELAIQIDASNNVIYSNTYPTKNLEFRVIDSSLDSKTGISVSPIGNKIGLFENTPSSIVNIGGDLVISGNLTVNGSSTTVNTSVLTVEDKNIELAVSSFPSDTNADGGGLVLKGSTDHTFIWSKDNAAWQSSENIEITSEFGEIRIGGVMVLSKNALGPGITNFLAVTQVGRLQKLEVSSTDPAFDSSYILIEDSEIKTAGPREDLTLKPQRDIVVSNTGAYSTKIVGVNTTDQALPPISRPSGIPLVEQKEATNKLYVENLVRRMPIILSLDVTDSITNPQIASYLNTLAPPDEFLNGTIARILCSRRTLSGTTVNVGSDVTKDQSVVYSTPTGTGYPLTDISFGNTVIPAPSESITREVRVFQIVGGSWNYLNTI